jgi:hypothetical protein
MEIGSNKWERDPIPSSTVGIIIYPHVVDLDCQDQDSGTAGGDTLRLNYDKTFGERHHAPQSLL